MSVLVTGAFGALGAAVTRALLEAGHSVRAFDVPSRANRRRAGRLARKTPALECRWGDITDATMLGDLVAGQAAVVHCAALLPPVSEQQGALAEAVNVEGTRLLIEALEREAVSGAGGGTGESERARPPAARFIYPSSVSIFGPTGLNHAPWTAADPIRPTDNYTRHKAACEELVRASSLPWLILRVGVALDAGQSKVSGDILGMMFEVSLENRLELVHPDDVAGAMVNALRSDEAWGRVLLIGGGASCRITQRELFECTFGAAGIGGLPEEAFGHGEFYTDWMDTGESQRLLGYQTRSFDDFRRECQRELRWVRWLVTPLRPLARWALLRYSRPWRDRRRS